MSWLLAVCVPGLLMLSTFGLQRLESGLHADRPAADEVVAEYLRAGRRRPGSRRRRDRVPRGTRDRCDGSITARLSDEPGLPTRPFAHARPNPQFQPDSDTPILCSVGSLPDGLPLD